MGLFKFCAIAGAAAANVSYDLVSAEAPSIHASVWNPIVPSELAKKSKIEPSLRDKKMLEKRNI
jgi:hypothetical protein